MPVETRKASKKSRGNEGRRIVGGAHEGTLSRITTNVLARLPEQGAIMALEAAQAEPELAGRVIAFSGRYATLPGHAPRDTCLHLLHGLDDAVLPHGSAVAAARRLVALGADVTADVLPQIGHELDPRLIERAIDQLRSFLPRRAWRAAMEAAPVQSTAASSKDLPR